MPRVPSRVEPFGQEPCCDVKDIIAITDPEYKDFARFSSDPAERRGGEVDQRLMGKDTGPPLYRDFRRMLDERSGEIDAVVCATPDHTHAIVSAAALRAGKPSASEGRLQPAWPTLTS
jgi:predicted dehydrogenase